jgi:transcriptional regulator with XRE-family HTH domain
MNGFSKLVYELRKEKGMTQAELGDKLGLTDKAVSRWENGESFPETAQLLPLSKIFGITIDELLNGERKPKAVEGCEADGGVSKSEKALDGLQKNSGFSGELLEFSEESEKNSPEDVRTVPTPKPMTMRETAKIVAGVFLILVGAAAVVIMTELDVSHKIYISVFLCFIAAAVFLFIHTGMNKTISDNNMPPEISQKAQKYILMICSGVCVFIVMVLSFNVLGDINIIVAFVVFFGLLMIGLALTIFGGVGWDREVEREIKAKKLKSSESKLSAKARKRDELMGKISGCIMLSATALFLLLGWTLNLWHPGWVVFPIGGILCGIAAIILEVSK